MPQFTLYGTRVVMSMFEKLRSNERVVMETVFQMALAMLLPCIVSLQGVSMAGAPPVYYVVFHHPGSQWRAGVDFREQPGVMEHVGYYREVFEAGKLKLGGPFLDNSGGMVVLTVASVQEAQQIADDDPAVKAGLLTVTVRPWMVPFSR